MSQKQEFECQCERQWIQVTVRQWLWARIRQLQSQRAVMLVQTSTRIQHSPSPGGFPGSGLTQAMKSGTAGMTESFIGRGGENDGRAGFETRSRE